MIKLYKYYYSRIKTTSLKKELQYSQIYSVQHTSVFKKWIRVKAKFTCINKEWELWRQTQFIAKFYNGNQEVQANMIRVHRFITDGETKEIYLDAKVPAAFSKVDVLFWHADSDKELKIDDLEIDDFDDF